jgi:hypothetical protein
MPFRSFAGSWRRISAVVVLALAIIIAPQATELCGAACARAGATMAMAMPAASMPAASMSGGEAGHCASHAASRHAAHAAHACGMPAHALPVQVDAATATAAPARASLAQLPQPTSSAMLPALTAAFSAMSGAPPPLGLSVSGLGVGQGLALDQIAARSARSHLLTLTLALRI